ncbi:MAG: hypothetical protein J0I47_00765 [Sphingomonas sp.]|uniref:DUF4139 domain-containing protein n=1 Tax=Sphingomonas sp. TaxID=28214 RepID=UPI001ACF37E8|nr:hypothetical protein [Sphingomonas sp.]MBN8806761.1 hypothetical protein [Sphingomonas sp.]
MHRGVLAPMLVAAAASAAAQPVATSPRADKVALTVYRAPYGRGAMDLRSLNGFALVTETRRIRLPRGAATLRFEGVASGIIPASAVVEGLPGGVVEKNRDARLLSPASLIDGTLGREVTLTRTNRATGRRESETATIVAGPSPGVVLRTAAGIETLRCSGLPEKLAFAGVPDGLSAKPVLSVETVSPAERTVTVRLSYLATGFDWRASYVATVLAGGNRLDLFAWLTLANANPEAFVGAEVKAVAGQLNRVSMSELRSAVRGLRLVCYPLGTTTSDLRERKFEEADDIIVTGSRVLAPPMVMMASPPAPAPVPVPPPPENLGDLKLYRVPGSTTVASNAQKQVALLIRSGVSFERRYRRPVYVGQTIDASPTSMVFELRNTVASGLGIALPAGSTAMYADRAPDQRLLLGLGALTDRAEGETFRIAAGTSTQVTLSQRKSATGGMTLRATNANPFAVVLDVPIGSPGQKLEADGDAIRMVDGRPTWSVTLPPGQTMELRYRSVD